MIGCSSHPSGGVSAPATRSSVHRLNHRDPRARNYVMDWKPFVYCFRAAGERTTLAIRDVSDHGDLCGAALDGLAVRAVSGR